MAGLNFNPLMSYLFFSGIPFETRKKVLKVAKIKDANYGCKDEGNEVSCQSVSCQSVSC